MPARSQARSSASERRQVLHKRSVRSDCNAAAKPRGDRPRLRIELLVRAREQHAALCLVRLCVVEAQGMGGLVLLLPFGLLLLVHRVGWEAPLRRCGLLQNARSWTCPPLTTEAPLQSCKQQRFRRTGSCVFWRSNDCCCSLPLSLLLLSDAASEIDTSS